MPRRTTVVQFFAVAAAGLLLTLSAATRGDAHAAAGTGPGLLGSYFANKTLSGAPTATRLDQVAFAWGVAAPMPGLAPKDYSVRWAGEIEAPVTGVYRLYVYSDGGVRVFLRGRSVVDGWKDRAQPRWYRSGLVRLKEGQRYPIVVEYFENKGGSVMELHWSAMGEIDRELVPRDRLYPGSSIVTSSTPTPSPSPAPTPSSSPTPVPTPLPTPTPSASPTPLPAPTPTPTPSSSPTPVPTPLPTPTPSASPTPLPTPTPTPTPSSSPTPVPTPLPTPTPSASPTPLPTPLPTPSPTPSPSPSAMPPLPTPANLRLLGPSDLVYEGAFRLPQGSLGTPDDDAFAYGGTALAYNPARDSLFLVGHDWHQLTTEVSIPDAVDSARLSDLPTATMLQKFTEASEGKMFKVDNDDAIKVGGLMAFDGQLYGTAYSWYDADGSQTLSHFVRPLDLSRRGEVRGIYQVGTQGAGHVAGPMAPVPEAWQGALGARALTGQCCVNIIGRTSAGPAVFGFDPWALDGSGPVAATPLVDYPLATPLAPWDGTNGLFNGSTQVRGIVFPVGTRSVLFLGRHGVGRFCYGTGSQCGDPVDPYKGTHAYPYVYQVWAYDALDLVAVRSGVKKPWLVQPYAVWQLQFPITPERIHINGAAYDPASRRLFVSQAFGDDARPLIHVYRLMVE